MGGEGEVRVRDEQSQRGAVVHLRLLLPVRRPRFHSRFSLLLPSLPLSSSFCLLLCGLLSECLDSLNDLSSLLVLYGLLLLSRLL